MGTKFGRVSKSSTKSIGSPQTLGVVDAADTEVDPGELVDATLGFDDAEAPYADKVAELNADAAEETSVNVRDAVLEGCVVLAVIIVRVFRDGSGSSDSTLEFAESAALDCWIGTEMDGLVVIVDICGDDSVG